MNTISYNQSPNFGMAFTKPNKQVMSYMRDALSELTPEYRTEFVDKMSKIVKNNEKCPVPIEQSIGGSYSPTYVASVGGRSFYVSHEIKGTKAEKILTTMRSAAHEAENINDINNNMKRIGKIFNIDG